MSGLTFWIIGGVIGLIGLGGLIVAAGSDSEGTYWGGLAVFAIAVLAEFWLIKRWFDREVTPLRKQPVEGDPTATVPEQRR